MNRPLFVLDDQCHYFNFELGVASQPGRTFVKFVEQFRSKWAGTEVHMGKQTAEEFVEEVFAKTATTVAGLNALGMTELFGGSMIGDVEDHARLMKRYPDRIVLYGYVNPLDGEKALQELEHQVLDLGARAIKLYPIDPRGTFNGWLCNDTRVAYPVFEKAKELGIKVVAVHKGITATAGPHRGVMKYLDPDDMEDPALNFPEINFFCYHMAYPEVEKIAGLCSLYDNMYVDLGNPVSISGVIQPMWFNDIMKRFLTLAPAAKMTWGTDQIVSPMIQECIEAFWRWQVPEEWERGYAISPISEQVKRKILGETVAGMLGMDVGSTLEKAGNDEFAARQDPRVRNFLSSFAGN